MPEMSFRLQHLNIPARGPGVLLAFQAGEPINRAPDLHAGFIVPCLAELERWAARLGGSAKKGPEFTAFQIRDPEGNWVELYCKSE